MSDEPADQARPWLSTNFILGWQGSLLACGGNHDELLSELEVLVSLVGFCEFGAVEDGPRIDCLKANRAVGVVSDIDEAEALYLYLRREQRERIRASARELYERLYRDFAQP